MQHCFLKTCDGLGARCKKCVDVFVSDMENGTNYVLAPSQQAGDNACARTLYRCSVAGKVIATMLRQAGTVDGTPASVRSHAAIWNIFDEACKQVIAEEHDATSKVIQEMDRKNAITRATKKVRGHPTGSGEYRIIKNSDTPDEPQKVSTEALATRARNCTRKALQQRKQVAGNVGETTGATCGWVHTSPNGYSLVSIYNATLYTGSTNVNAIASSPHLLIAMFPK